MKIRNGFVSNSSASSFICGICNDLYMVMDGDPTGDERLATCVSGHSFCRKHILINTDQEDEPFFYNIPQDYCPICSFKEITEGDLNAYIMAFARENSTEEEIAEEIRNRFKTYRELEEYINKYHPPKVGDIYDDF